MEKKLRVDRIHYIQIVNSDRGRSLHDHHLLYAASHVHGQPTSPLYVRLGQAVVAKRQLFPLHLDYDALGIVVAESARQLVVIHGRVVGVLAPEERHLGGIADGELVLPASVGPLDEVRAVGSQQQFQQKLPQLRLVLSRAVWRKRGRVGIQLLEERCDTSRGLDGVFLSHAMQVDLQQFFKTTESICHIIIL